MSFLCVSYKIFYKNATDIWNDVLPNEIIRKKSERLLSNLPALLCQHNQHNHKAHKSNQVELFDILFCPLFIPPFIPLFSTIRAICHVKILSHLLWGFHQNFKLSITLCNSHRMIKKSFW